MAATVRYRCPVCGANIQADAADTMPVCNGTDRCGFLFDTDRAPATPTPTRRTLKFALTDIPDGGYRPDDERRYTVHHHGRTIGTVERTWLLPGTPGDPPPAGWAFQSDDRQHSGEGHTRADAVTNAYRSQP